MMSLKSATLALFGLLVISLFFQASPPKVTHDFPAEMKPEVKAQYIVLWEKGKVLFDLNCAKCHMVKRGKKVLYPDFSPGQIKGYEIRVQNAKHEEALPEENVTPEELGLISTFLTYKTRNPPLDKK
jgi:mono/diheme cytochrome c family protein